jgi:CubicO group peptidase (beta-lactamase class C family)
MAAAGLWTTAEDLAKFVIDVQLAVKEDKGKVLSQSMTNKMLTPFVSDHVGLGFFIEQTNVLNKPPLTPRLETTGQWYVY